MIKGVILDGDGTILDSMQIWDSFAQECLEDLGLPEDGLKPGELENASLKDAAKLFIERFGLQKTEEEMLAFFLAKLRSIYANEIRMINGAPEFLAELERRDIPAVIATAGDGECVRSVLRRYGLEQTCDGVFDCKSVSIGKTDPAMYNLARESMNLAKDEVMVFEDALYALETAWDNGYPCIAICTADERDYEQKKAHSLLTMPDYLHLDAFWAMCEEKSDD